MLEATEDEQYERRWQPVFEHCVDCGMSDAIIGNTAHENEYNEYTEEYWNGLTSKRAIDKPSAFVLLIVPGGVMEHAMLLTYSTGLGNTVLFQTSEDAFNYGTNYVDDPWQVVEL